MRKKMNDITRFQLVGYILSMEPKTFKSQVSAARYLTRATKIEVDSKLLGKLLLIEGVSSKLIIERQLRSDTGDETLVRKVSNLEGRTASLADAIRHVKKEFDNNISSVNETVKKFNDLRFKQSKDIEQFVKDTNSRIDELVAKLASLTEIVEELCKSK